MNRRTWGKCEVFKWVFLGVGNPFLCIGKFLGSWGCKHGALLENQAVETKAFVLGSQGGLQQWKHLEPVTFKIFGFNV